MKQKDNAVPEVVTADIPPSELTSPAVRRADGVLRHGALPWHP